MSLATELLNAKHVGVRDLRDHLSEMIKKDTLVIVTEHGQPSKVLIPYEDMLEIVDMMDELRDHKTSSTVLEGKYAITKAPKGISVTSLFNKFRTHPKKHVK